MENKYIFLNHVTMRDIAKSSALKNEIDSFISYWSNRGYKFHDEIPFTPLITYIKKRDVKSCLTDWLIDNKYIEEVREKFKPFRLNFDIDSLEDLKILWHCLNISNTEYNERMANYKSYFETAEASGTNKISQKKQSFWDIVDEKLKEHEND